MRRKEFDSLLMDWCALVAEITTDSAYPSSTTLHRCIELGAQGAAIRAGGRIESNYWPKHNLILINNAVETLPLDDKNILIMKRVMGFGWAEIAKRFNVQRWNIRNRIDSIENTLYKQLK